MSLNVELRLKDTEERYRTLTMYDIHVSSRFSFVLLQMLGLRFLH